MRSLKNLELPLIISICLIGTLILLFPTTVNGTAYVEYDAQHDYSYWLNFNRTTGQENPACVTCSENMTQQRWAYSQVCGGYQGTYCANETVKVRYVNGGVEVWYHTNTCGIPNPPDCVTEVHIMQHTPENVTWACLWWNHGWCYPYTERGLRFP